MLRSAITLTPCWLCMRVKRWSLAGQWHFGLGDQKERAGARGGSGSVADAVMLALPSAWRHALPPSLGQAGADLECGQNLERYAALLRLLEPFGVRLKTLMAMYRLSGQWQCRSDARAVVAGKCRNCQPKLRLRWQRRSRRGRFNTGPAPTPTPAAPSLRFRW